MNVPLFYRLIAFSLAFLLAVAPAAARTWNIDSKRSKAIFKVKHLKLFRVTGKFTDVQGTVEYDKDNLKLSKVSARIDVGSLKTGNFARDKHLKDLDFFFLKEYPYIKFESRRIIPSEMVEDEFKMVGILTLRGKSEEVILDVKGPTKLREDSKGNVTLGAIGTTRLDRTDFGIVQQGFSIADRVNVTVDIEMSLPVDQVKKPPTVMLDD